MLLLPFIEYGRTIKVTASCYFVPELGYFLLYFMSESRSRRPPAPVTVATPPPPSGEEQVDEDDTPLNATDTPAAPTLHGKEGAPGNYNS